MTERIFEVVLKWVPMAIIITALCGLVYVSVQQNWRADANNPQIQMAEDAAAALANGASMQSLVPANKVDIASSLAAYVMVFDERGDALASSAQLDGTTPTIPAGVFAYTREHGEDRLTWQPRAGVRSAIVVTHFSGGFVVAGRSLREVERQESNLTAMVFAAWFASLGATLVASIALVWMQSWSKSLHVTAT